MKEKSPTKKERLETMISILRKEDIHTQEELQKRLTDEFSTPTDKICFAQSTISKDLKKIGYIKDPKEGYIKSDDKVFTEIQEILSRLISYVNPRFRMVSTTKKDIYILYIYTGGYLEKSISELIDVFYDDWIKSTFIGNKCVVVHLPYTPRAKQVKKELENFAKMIF